MLTPVYDGSGGVGTFDLTGNHGDYVPSAGRRTRTLKVNGSAVKSFVLGQGRLLTFRDLYDAISAYGKGWSVAAGTASAQPATIATFTGTISNTTLTIDAGSIAGAALAVGQTVFTSSLALTTIKAISGNTITLASAVITKATSFAVCTGTPIHLFSKACVSSAKRAGDFFGLASGSSIYHADTRTLILFVDGVPVKSFPAIVDTPCDRDASGNFDIDDYTLTAPLAGMPIGKLCRGLVSAINEWATAANNGWSGSTTDSDTGGLLKGCRLRMTEMCAPIIYGRSARRPY